MPIFVVSHDQPVSINKDADFIFVTKDIESDYRQAKSKDEDKMYGSWWSKYCTTVPAIGFDR